MLYVIAVESHHSEMLAGDYSLIGADLRQLREFEEKLKLADVRCLDVTVAFLLIFYFCLLVGCLAAYSFRRGVRAGLHG
jgi:hypothetical protein